MTEKMTNKIYTLDEAEDPMLFFGLGMDRQFPAWQSFLPTGDILHLGPGKKDVEFTIPFDRPEYDFDSPELKLPYEPGTCAGAVATHVLEHLQDPRILLLELARVLAPKAPFNILVPHAKSTMFLQDLDHKTPFVLDTWKNLFDETYYQKDDLGSFFELGFNAIMAITENNVALVTQLIRR